MSQRLDNLQLALSSMPTLANHNEIEECLSRGADRRYLALTRSDQGRIWAYFCPSLAAARQLFADQLSYQDSHRPFALVDLDQGTITYDIKVSITVDYLEPLVRQQGAPETLEL